MDDLFSPVLVESPKRDYEIVVYDYGKKPFIVDTIRNYNELTAMCRKLARIKRAYEVIVWQFGHKVARCELNEIRRHLI